MKNKLFILGLLVLLIVSVLFRFPLLDYSPPELFGDEIDMAYQAYTLLNTGKDMYGQVLPVYIHSLSEWLVPLWMYSTVPTLAVLGPNEWGARLPVAVFGSIGVIIFALLVYQTTKNKRLAFFAGLILATMPWHIHYSRAAFGVVLMLDLGLMGTLLFLRKRWVLSAISFGLCLYSYSTAWMFVPLLIFVLIVATRFKPSWKGIGTFIFVVIPLAWVFMTGIATRRIGSINVASQKEIIDEVIANRNEAPGALSRVFFNRPTRVVAEIANNYMRSFSPEFLFVRGDPIYRHNMQYGELLPATFLLVIIGLYYLVKQKQWIWLIWLALAPLPSSITEGGGWHATRLFWMVPALAIAGAAGAELLFGLKLKLAKLVLLGIAALTLFQISFGAYYYVRLYPQRSWRWWQTGYKSAMQQLAVLAPNYQKIFINNSYEPALPRFLFWTNYSPEKYLKNFTIDQHQKDIVNGFDGFSLEDKYYFGVFNETARGQGIAQYMSPGNLYLVSQRDDVGISNDWRISPPLGIIVRGVSVNSYNEPIFYLVEKNGQ